MSRNALSPGELELLERLVEGSLFHEIAALLAVAQAARARMRVGHNDTCGHALGPYACSCGYDAVGESLEALDALRKQDGK